MLIKFKENDPRSGMTARMDSSLGQQFIDAGVAVRVSDAHEVDAPDADAHEADAPSVKRRRKNADPHD